MSSSWLWCYVYRDRTSARSGAYNTRVNPRRDKGGCDESPVGACIRLPRGSLGARSGAGTLGAQDASGRALGRRGGFVSDRGSRVLAASFTSAEHSLRKSRAPTSSRQ